MFLTSRLDPGHSLGGRTQRMTSQFRPRWFGQDLSRTDVTGLRSTPGNEGWSEREGQPPGPSGIEMRLTPAGEVGSERTPTGLASADGVCPRISLDSK